MLLYQSQKPDGGDAFLELNESEDDRGFLLTREDGVRARLPARIIISVLERYGRALDDGITTDGDELILEPGVTLRRFRFRSAVDAIGRDYLALLVSGQETVAAMAVTVAGALDHLLDT